MFVHSFYMKVIYNIYNIIIWKINFGVVGLGVLYGGQGKTITKVCNICCCCYCVYVCYFRMAKWEWMNT